MEALPTEILDLIMLEVENLGMYPSNLLRLYPSNLLRLYPSKATTFELARRGGGLEHDLGFRALTTIRLVSKIICRSASKLVFRNINVACTDLDGSEALMRLEDISNSPWATDVRKLDMWFCPQFFEGMDRHSGEFHDFFNKLQSLFKRLPNLEAFNLYPGAFDRRYEAFINMAVQTVRSLPLRSLTELEISHHYTIYCGTDEFLPMAPDSETPRDGLENLRHLGLKGHFTWEKDSEVEFGQLIRTAVNIESLRLQYHCSETMPNTLHFIIPRRLRYLQLQRGFISAKELTYLLKNCKESIRYIDISAEMRHGSVLQLLFQMSRSLKLFDFSFLLPYIRDVDSSKIEGLENGLRQDARNESILCLYAYNDIQRQVKANRLAAGLIPLQRRYIYVETPPLRSVMDAAHYQELCSLPEL